MRAVQRAPQLLSTVLGLVLLLSTPALAQDRFSAHALSPRKPRKRQTITLGGEVQRYQLIDLEPHTGYEVRLSYPATNPAYIHFQWETPSGGRARGLLASSGAVQHGRDGSASSAWRVAAPQQQSGDATPQPGARDVRGDEALVRLGAWRGRRLLNLEKIMFESDGQGHAPGVLLLSAQREGHHRDGPMGGGAVLMYNIELAPAFLGVPTIAFPIAMYVLVGALIILRWLPAAMDAWLPALVRRIAQPSSRSG